MESQYVIADPTAPEIAVAPETGEVGEYVPLPEMGGIAWMDVYLHYSDRNKNPAVTRVNVTQRHPVSAVAALEMLLTDLKEFMQTDLGKHVRFDNLLELPSRQVEKPAPAPAQAQPAATGFGKPAAQPAAAFGSKPAAAAPAQAPTPASSDVKTGRQVLDMIKVLPPDPGKKAVIEFHCQGLKWPIKESRGGEIAAAYFDPEIGVTADHLSTPGTFAQAEFGQVLYLYWEKPDKYTNVVKVSNK